MKEVITIFQISLPSLQIIIAVWFISRIAKRPKLFSTRRLDNTIAASNRLAELAAEKNKIKSDYYEKKLQMMERGIAVKEEISNSLKYIGTSLDTIASAYTGVVIPSVDDEIWTQNMDCLTSLIQNKNLSTDNQKFTFFWSTDRLTVFVAACPLPKKGSRDT